MEDRTLLSTFLVNTTGDSGSGSLRQAILDSDAAGGSNTIDFAISGHGVQTISPVSPLPAITSPVLIDGASQPGYAGTPLIAVTAPSSGGSDVLAIGSNTTVRGLEVDGFAFGSAAAPETLTVDSSPLPPIAPASTGAIDTYRIDTTTEVRLVAQVQAAGVVTRLLLRDAQGNLLRQSDGQSAANPDDVIDVSIAPGEVFLEVQNLGGAGTYTLSTTVTPATAPFQPIPVTSQPSAIVTGDFAGNGLSDIATTNLNTSDVSVLLGNGNGTFQPQRTYAAGTQPWQIVTGDFTGNGILDLATANLGSNNVSILLGNGDGTFQPQVTYPVGSYPTGVVAGDFTGDGHLDLAVADQGSDDVSVLLGNGDGTFISPNLLVTTPHATPLVADLSGDGLTDLVVRNAGDGTFSVFFGTAFDRSQLVGPFNPQLLPPSFTAPVTLPVGLGVSDVQATDPTGAGALDLVVTNKLTGLVSILRNLGDGAFAPPEPYRAGTGLSAVDSTSTPEVTSLDATAGVAAGQLVPGSPTDLVTINPGSNTLDVLAGLGGGRFANPATIDTPSPALVVRMADFTGNGIDDLAVLTTSGVSIYLGNGKGGFLPPTTYAVPPEADGLTVADINHDGKRDLLVGDAYGDVLVLLGQGNGTFLPYHEANQAVELAVADLTGNGSKDIIYADQGLDRVVVDYGAGQSAVLGDRSQGILDPGAVALADLNGDGIPDLIVANSGSNNVLVYPGLGNGQFGPALNGGHGYFVGTNPVAIAVADLNGQPDLLVANAGSNDVSVMLGEGHGASWTLIPGPRIETQGGPDALAVGSLTAGGTPDLFVANGQADTVVQFQGVGYGFFKQTPAAVYPVGQAPSALFLGNFSGLGLGLATLNAGSNNGTLITGLGSGSPQTRTFPTGGEQPTTGFAGDFTGNGFTDLVVGNTGDGHLALLLGGSGGLSLSQTLVSALAPSPTSLSFVGVSNGVLSFYVSTAGREAAVNLAFDLGGGAGSESLGAVTPGVGLPSAGVLAQATSGSVQQVAQLASFSGTTLELAATLLTVSVAPGNNQSESSGGAVAAAGSVWFGQPPGQALKLLQEEIPIMKGNEA